MQPMHKVNIVILALLYNNLEEIYLPYRFNVTRLLMELSYCVLVWEKIYKEKMRYLLSVLIFCGLVLLRVDTHIHMNHSWLTMVDAPMVLGQNENKCNVFLRRQFLFILNCDFFFIANIGGL